MFKIRRIYAGYPGVGGVDTDSSKPYLNGSVSSAKNSVSPEAPETNKSKPDDTPQKSGSQTPNHDLPNV